MNVEKIINNILSLYFNKRKSDFYKKQFRSYLLKNRFKNIKQEGEEEYIKKWEKLSRKKDPYSFRLFSHFCNPDYIIPEYLGVTVLEYYLNPLRFRSFYCDKNLYQRYIRNSSYFPETYLRRINGGGVLNANYECLIKSKELVTICHTLFANNIKSDKIILKPTIDTASGTGVCLFRKKGDVFINDSGEILDGAFLNKYGNDFIIQECIEQHPIISRLCTTSINTIRVCTYRSVVSDEVKVTGTVLRVGKNGSIVDNAHQGGLFVPVDIRTGKLAGILYNQYGEAQHSWNDINYSHEQIYIPNWNEVLSFAKQIGECNSHCRLLALDICIDKQGKPRIIEINSVGFGWWLFMFCNQDVFGGEQKAVIDYCYKHLCDDKRTLFV